MVVRWGGVIRRKSRLFQSHDKECTNLLGIV